MAPKTNCNPAKLASVVSWMQKSGTAWSIKDLEKQLPSVASINGMQVKDYLQSLSDENKIRVEKIGSGNWYWSFASEDRRTREAQLATAVSAHDKQAAVIAELKQKAANAEAARADEAEMLENGDDGDTREALEERKAGLEGELAFLKKEVTAYKDTDPTEFERQKQMVERFRADVEVASENILAMESWLLNAGVDRQAMDALRQSLYGDELDPDGGMLRDIV